VLYSNVGAQITYGGSDLANVLGIEEGKVRFNLNYVQVPIAVVANLGPFNVHAGPYLSYLVGANVKNLKTADLTPIRLPTWIPTALTGSIRTSGGHWRERRCLYGRRPL
jgi:hypothetical protein